MTDNSTIQANSEKIINQANMVIAQIDAARRRAEKTMREAPTDVDRPVKNVKTVVVPPPPRHPEIADVALIECFFGTDPRRIQAVARQLAFMLASDPKPAEFVFVEAQPRKRDAAFGWLSSLGVKYVFRKYGKDSEGLLLKTALWNIGAKECSSGKLCFVDADVMMENSDWAAKAEAALEKFDVASLSKTVRYEDETRLRATVGAGLAENRIDGHVGFTLGMTRRAYEMYGGFEAFGLHDDVWIWNRIVGTDRLPQKPDWMPYAAPASMARGMPLNVGAADNSAVHLYHGVEDRKRYRLFGFVENRRCSVPFEDIAYDKSNPDVLPTWADCRVGNTVRRAFRLIREAIPVENAEEQAADILEQAEIETAGEAGAVVIATAYRENFVWRGTTPVLEFEAKLREKCMTRFQLLVFTDAFSTEEAAEIGVDAVPFSSDAVRDDEKLWPSEKHAPHVRFPPGAVVVWMPMDKPPERRFRVAADGVFWPSAR